MSVSYNLQGFFYNSANCIFHIAQITTGSIKKCFLKQYNGRIVQTAVNSKLSEYLSIYLSIRFYNSCRRLPETKRHSSPFLHWSVSKFLVVMAACTPSIHVFLGRPLFLLSSGTHSIINFGILSSGILLKWSYHCSLFFCMKSMMSGFPFTPIISFICSTYQINRLKFIAYKML